MEYALPAPGCPTKFPVYKSVSAVCGPLDEKSCPANELCRRNTSNGKCYPKEGTITPEIDPAAYKRMGIAEMPDYAEFTPMKACVVGKPCERDPKERGQDYFKNSQFSAAIAEYSKALQENPNDPQALSLRAATYELTGERAAAIADYCRILVVYSKRERRANARTRIAQLSGQPDARSAQGAATTPSATASPPPNLQPVPPPRTSTIDDGGRRGKIAPFSVEVGPGTNYLVKLVNASNDRDYIVMFVKGGETYSTKVPLGEYNVRAAMGDVWYGKKDFFGPDTRFVRLRAKNGGLQSFEFYRRGNTVHGKRLILKKIMEPGEGNMEEERITRDQF